MDYTQLEGNPTTEILTKLDEGISLRESDPEQAKDLLSQAERFLTGEARQECLIHLAIAYNWTGEHAEGLALIDDLLGDAPSNAIRCRALLAKATLQASSPAAALATLAEAEQCCAGAGPAYRGMWHNERALAYKGLKDYDKASIDYAGAAAFFEEAGDARRAAAALNNSAGVLLKWGKHEEALEAVARAVGAFSGLADPLLPHAQDQQAQILVALGRAEEARTIIDKVLISLNGDRKELVLECLLTRASALIQLGMAGHAFQDVDRAQEIGDYLGRQDLILTVAKARKELAASFAKQAYVQAVELALKQSEGNLRESARKLGIAHSTLKEYIKTHGIDRKPARLKSIIRKS